MNDAKQRRKRKPIAPDSLFIPHSRCPEVTGVSLQTIDRAIREKQLIAYRVPATAGARRYKILIKRADLLAWVTAEQHDPRTGQRFGYISPFRKEFVEEATL